jgi:DNA-binding MarR family transcriptional regulator
MNTLTHKKIIITKQQLKILKYIYLFRFITTNQLKQVLGRNDLQQIQKRLNLLLKRGYITRNYLKNDIKHNIFATYYLVPEGLKVLKKHDQTVHLRIIRRIYHDRKAKPQFIARHNLLGDLYILVRKQYGDNLRFFTNSELVGYEYLDELQPHAYITFLNPKGSEHPKQHENTKLTTILPNHYFIEICQITTPLFVLRKRIRQYIDYIDSGIWQDETDTQPPAIHLVCDSEQLKKRVHKLVYKELQESYMSDVEFRVTTVMLTL